MARPKGTKYIETPERMWELFTEYKKHIHDNPIYAVEQKKGNTSIRLTAKSEGEVKMDKPSDLVYVPLKRPLTMEGFENYVADLDIVYSLDQYFSNRDNNYTDYLGICSRIRREIRQDQIEGGMVNIYNASITQRLNGLVDKQSVEANVKLNQITGMTIKE